MRADRVTNGVLLAGWRILIAIALVLLAWKWWEHEQRIGVVEELIELKVTP